jgi:hypothetical protein
MTFRRLQETILIIVFSALAALTIGISGSSSSMHIIGGVALVLILPWTAASRLAVVRQLNTLGARLSTSAALTFSTVILLGLLLSATPPGITTHGIIVGVLVMTVFLAIAGVPGDHPLPSLKASASLAGLVIVSVAMAITTIAFVAARNRALTQAERESSYAAFLLPHGHSLNVGVQNPTNGTTEFIVRANGRHQRHEARVSVPAYGVRIIRNFVAQPPALLPIQRTVPRTIQPKIIHVYVRIHGRKVGPRLTLSTY